ncbi:ABC transporter [bacterium A37T11]|nr:ABC transporter [bacterium A37T11]
MEIILENIGRRFNRDWIFKGINYAFITGETYAILGPNGSGKSTFLQVLAASLSPSAGKLGYRWGGGEVDINTIYQFLSLAAPYLELPEEFTLKEAIAFHFRYKRYRPGTDMSYILDLLNFGDGAHKELHKFSSGMKQRTKLALAFCADTPLLLLDEPTANLDKQGMDWYLDLVKEHSAGRTVVIGSNQPQEYAFCRHTLKITDFKS